MPDRSGLPSAARGAGALTFGRPSVVRGTPGVGYGGHCAEIEGPMVAPIAVAASAWRSVFMTGSADLTGSPAFAAEDRQHGTPQTRAATTFFSSRPCVIQARQ